VVCDDDPAVSAFDLPLDQLRAYRPERTEPADFDPFWAETLATSRAAAAATPPRFERIESPLRTVTVDDVTFPGFAGQPIRGWFLAPTGATAAEPLPTVVEYIGYGGGRSLPFEWLRWASAGYAHFVMDTRGQGSAWSPGATSDVDADNAGGHFPGFVTRGIANPETWYYRRLVTDAILALDAAASHPLADPARLLVTGQSQGGGLALAAVGLSSAVRAAAVDVPFMCCWRRALEVTDEHPYQELTRYLAVHRDHEATVFRTLAYADGLNFAARATIPARFSVGLMDAICPPSTVFAAYNHYAGPKEMRVWPYNGHEAGQLVGQADRYAFFAGLGIAP
jgi:cephalosporin-C deacetylase